MSMCQEFLVIDPLSILMLISKAYEINNVSIRTYLQIDRMELREVHYKPS